MFNSTFETDIYSAFVIARECANKIATDKPTRSEFDKIAKILTNGRGDARERLTPAQSSLIRRYYLKSLEA